MHDSRLDIALGLFTGIWAGLALGLLRDEWGWVQAIEAAVIAVPWVIASLRRSDPPRPQFQLRWRRLSGGGKRDVIRALARGEAARPENAALAEDIGHVLAGERTRARDWVGLVARVAGAAALPVVAATEGAPLGWVVAAGCFPILLVAAWVITNSPRTRDLARQAASVNHALRQERKAALPG